MNTKALFPLRLLIVISLGFMGGCRLPSGANLRAMLDASEVRRAELPEQENANAPYVSDLDDAARFMAGMPGRSRPLAGVRDTDRWKLHRANVTELWRQFSDYRQPRIDAFARKECGLLRSQNTIFYPFSGPDILFATAFFPGAANYVLCGLEGTDPLPDFSQLSSEQILFGLDGIYTSITTALNCSFFITKDMRVDLQRTEFKGTMPIILVFLSRLGMTIDSTTPITLGPDGRVVELAAGSQASGYLVRCHSAFGQTKNIYYFRQNLANGAFSQNSKLMTFLNSQGAFATYVKSASYLMHSGEFSEIRSAILKRSVGLLQDDSGIPYRYFAQNGWETRLYGNYEGVLDIFKNNFQTDLHNAYKQGSTSVESIDFGVGYKFEAGHSNLLIGHRR